MREVLAHLKFYYPNLSRLESTRIQDLGQRSREFPLKASKYGSYWKSGMTEEEVWLDWLCTGAAQTREVTAALRQANDETGRHRCQEAVGGEARTDAKLLSE